MDSVNEDYISLLSSTHIKMAMSPIHDKDVMFIDDVGTVKKPHRHVLIDFGGSARVSQVDTICNLVNAYSVVEWVASKQGAYDYLTHRKNPDKYQYSEGDIIHFNSDVHDWRDSAFIDILNYIDDKNLRTLIGLTKSLRREKDYYLLKYVCDNSYFIDKYLSQKKDKDMQQLSDMYNHIVSLIDVSRAPSLDIAQVKDLLKQLYSLNDDDLPS